MKATTKEWYLAVAFLLSSDQIWYSRCIEEQENSFFKGQDEYPCTITAAINLISKYKHEPCDVGSIVGQMNDGVSFLKELEPADQQWPQQKSEQHWPI